MSDEPKNSFPIAKTIPIREAGDEYTETWFPKVMLKSPQIVTQGQRKNI